MRPFLPMILASALLAGCGGREVVRETVVERPIVRETIVERPTAAGATAPSCSYASQSYSHGSISCQEGREFRCDQGNWSRTEVIC